MASSNWVATDDTIGAQPLTQTSTTQKHALGKIMRGRDLGSTNLGEGEFIYLAGAASTTPGDVVQFDTYNGTTTRWAGTANDTSSLAIALSANVASQYGWYQIAGAAVVNVSGTVAAGDHAFWEATATVSSTAVAGKQVLGMKALSANGTPTTAQAIYEIDRPQAQGQIT